MDVRDRSEVCIKIMTDVFRLTVACGVVPVPGFYDHGVSPLKTEKRQKKEMVVKLQISSFFHSKC